MGPRMKPEERIAAELKKISRQEGNRVCADCPERMPSYVNLTHGTFVCTKCSGILRELQYRIKGISMSTFDVEEVKSLAERGNTKHNSIYMAHFDETRDQRPNLNVTEKMKEFIKSKYKDEKWKQGGGGPARRDSWGSNAGNGAPTSAAARHARHRSPPQPRRPSAAYMQQALSLSSRVSRLTEP